MKKIDVTYYQMEEGDRLEDMFPDTWGAILRHNQLGLTGAVRTGSIIEVPDTMEHL